MSQNSIFEEIESADFQARYMIFSGFKLMRKALAREETVRLLIDEIRLNPSWSGDVSKRIHYLSASQNGRAGAAIDVAVAAYLYCLYQTDQRLAKLMSEYVLRLGKLWWSVDLALQITKNIDKLEDTRLVSVSQ